MLLAVVPWAWAQPSRIDVSVGGGLAWMRDDLYFNGNTPAFQAGASLDWPAARKNPALTEVLSWRTAASVARRGGTFWMDFPSLLSERHGSYEAYYLQLTAQPRLQLRMPPSFPRDHFATLRLGPTLSLALAGTLHDEQRCGHYPDAPEVNFCETYTGFGIHSQVRSFDLGLETALGYQMKDWTFELVWNAGLLPLRRVTDALIYVDVEPPAPDAEGVIQNPTGRSGQLSALSLSVSYSLTRRRPSRHPENPFKR